MKGFCFVTTVVLTLQLPLEPPRLELHGSTYTWIFFKSRFYRTTRLVESMDAKPRILWNQKLIGCHQLSVQEVFLCIKVRQWITLNFK